MTEQEHYNLLRKIASDVANTKAIVESMKEDFHALKTNGFNIDKHFEKSLESEIKRRY